MKQAQNARKQRGRPAPRKGGRNGGGGGGGNRSENRPRGNPKQLLEKYKTQARDALQAGDRVNAEYYLQFADHYQRVVNEQNSREQTNTREQNNNREQSNKREQSSSSEKDDRQQPRKGRGRRDHRQNKPADAGSESGMPDQDNSSDNALLDGEKTIPVDLASSEQPVEVHPELDAGSKAVSSEVTDEKPKRRAPRRRASTSEQASAQDASSETAAAASTQTPEGDAAA